jgi:phosphotransferase system  glucose/maltose/N-acetylglucosamine-specific IIC component
MPLTYLLVAIIVGSLTLGVWIVTGGGLLGGLTAYTLGGNLAMLACVARCMVTRKYAR